MICTNEAALVNLALNYNLRIQVFSELILVSSKIDHWIIKVFSKRIELWHKNTKYNVKDYHLQKTYNKELATYEQIFQYIKGHDNYVLCHKGKNKVVELINSL